MSDPRYEHDRFLIRRKVLKLIGGAFHIFDDQGNVVLYSKMKGFKLKEDIRLFGDESMAEELLVISARSWLDFSTAYDVTDTRSGEKVGALKRKGMKSILRDEWLILDPMDHEIGVIREDSAVRAMLRRTIAGFLPQKYTVEVGGHEVATMQQNFNPFVFKLQVDFSADSVRQLDRRLGIVAGILLSAIEGRQG